MSLAAGTRLGPYEVLGLIGSGGMGEVYKAKDTRLDRTVAIKVLPAEKVADPERRHRFVQEAKAASAFHHPHIITVHDIAQAEGLDFIVMEYVEGRTLDAIIPRAGMRLGEVLKIGVQIARALAAAHSQGIVHRDLKPGNVMVTPGGSVKVVDFGLAKLNEAASPGPDAETHTVGARTGEGVILGTAAYMSPEQAEGKPVDARSDIFSFGAVLYEMATGRQAFAGDSTVSTLSAVLREEPKPLEGLPHDLEKTILRCLRKDPDKRFQHMDDVCVALEELKEESDSGKLGFAPPEPTRSSRWRRLTYGVAAASLLLAVAAAAWLWHSAGQQELPPPPNELTATALTSYSGSEFQPSFSPDGTKVAFVWNGDKQDNLDIYVKQIGSAGPPMRLTTSAAAEFFPAWSPDDRWIAFTRSQPEQRNVAVLLIPPLGGPERKLTETIGIGGLSWTRDGKWLVLSERDSEAPMSIWAISIETGERRRLTTFLTTARATEDLALGDFYPSISPDGRSLAFARQVRNYVWELYVLPLTRDLQPGGEPVRISDQRYPNIVGLAWTGNGQEIVYSAGGYVASTLWRVSVSGRQRPRGLPYALPAARYPAIARTPQRLVYGWMVNNVNLWRLNIRTGERKTLIGSTYYSYTPQYSPDGSKIAFQSNQSGNAEVWTCDADGSNCQQLTSFGGPQGGSPRWSPDSRWLALDSRVEGQSEIYVILADGGPLRRVTNSPPFSSTRPSWSRDGRWIYFGSDRTGRIETWKIPVGGGQAVQITRSGGVDAQESPDGKYLYYVKEPGPPGLFRMPVEGGEEKQVLPGAIPWPGFGVTAKGVYFRIRMDRTIRFLDEATGKITTVATLDKPAMAICVSPDDAYVVWAQVDRNTQDLMLVEGFR